MIVREMISKSEWHAKAWWAHNPKVLG